MVAIEVIHFMKTNTRGNDMYVALKLYISKAYDRMDWDYLQDVTVKMGFHSRGIHLMGVCGNSRLLCEREKNTGGLNCVSFFFFIN